MNKNVGISYKALVLLLAVVLVLGGTIGGTMAWLIDDHEAVANVFTDSDVDIEFNETTKDYQMIPGHTIDKNPTVTVSSDSEDCYVFVKIEKSANYDTYLAPYAVNSSIWTKLEKDIEGKDLDGVYYREVLTEDASRTFSILDSGKYTDPDASADGEFTWSENQVLVRPSVTKEQMNDINKNVEDEPTLTFTTYAVQLNKTNEQKFDVAVAWEKAKVNEQNATNN